MNQNCAYIPQIESTRRLSPLSQDKVYCNGYYNNIRIVEPTCQQFDEMSANHFTGFSFDEKVEEKAYSFWKLSDCQRAKELLFIPPHSTAQLLREVDESYADSKELYYKLNYTVPMQTYDGQTVIYRLENGKEIGVFNTEMQVNGKALYAVFGRNHRSNAKQQYQIIKFTNADELAAEYGICHCDIPKGFDFDLKAESAAVEVSEQVINDFFLGQTKVKFIASQQNGQKARYNRQGCIQMTRRQFRLAAIESLRWMHANNAPMPLIADLQTKDKYFSYDLAKVLPVWLEEHKAFVGLIFKATGVYKIAIDLKDLRNKANLIQNIPVNSKEYEWMFYPNRINNLQMVNAFDDDIPQDLPRLTLAKRSSSIQSESTYCQDGFSRSPSSSPSQTPLLTPMYPSIVQPAVCPVLKLESPSPSFQYVQMNVEEMNAYVTGVVLHYKEQIPFYEEIANSNNINVFH